MQAARPKRTVSVILSRRPPQRAASKTEVKFPLYTNTTTQSTKIGKLTSFSIIIDQKLAENSLYSYFLP